MPTDSNRLLTQDSFSHFLQPHPCWCWLSSYLHFWYFFCGYCPNYLTLMLVPCFFICIQWSLCMT